MSLEPKIEDVEKKLTVLYQKVSEKLGIKEKQFNEELETAKSEVKQGMPNASDAVVLERSYAKLRVQYKELGRSPAISFEGIVLGAGEPYDMIARQKADAVEIFREDKSKAIGEGWTDTDGIPLDRRTSFGARENRNYGKPLPPHEYIRNVISVIQHDGEATLAKLVLTGGKALIDIPVGEPVRFRANVRKEQNDQSALLLNPASVTKFVKIGSNDIDARDILEGDIVSDFKVDLGDLSEYHEATANDPRRLLITAGDVETSMETSTGNTLIVLDDDTLDFDDPSVPVFVPPILANGTEYMQGSRVWIVGRSGKGKDRDTGEPRYNITAYGVILGSESYISGDTTSGVTNVQ